MLFGPSRLDIFSITICGFSRFMTWGILKSQTSNCFAIDLCFYTFSLNLLSLIFELAG
uniref:Uncharacterized protein n=1 Tax=Arundo donax TaxID=35708 RepID=A0A0A9F018_ARUDO